MNEENIKVFIDFGSSKIRLGVFSKEISKNIIILEEDCISNFSLKKLDMQSLSKIKTFFFVSLLYTPSLILDDPKSMKTFKLFSFIRQN